MKLVTIKYFKEKHQERITFVRTLIDYQNGLGLKSAKEMLDNMLDGVPVKYQISENKLADFTRQLDSLKLEYEISLVN
jgi:DNA-binding transcriptional MerR regulator